MCSRTPPVSGWSESATTRPAPFAPAPLQGLRRYYGAIRPSPRHRYSRLTALDRLGFSLGIQGLVPAVPRRRLCPTHALYTPAAARPVTRLPTGLSQETQSPLVSTALDKLTMRHRRVCFRSPFEHPPAPVIAGTFHLTLTTTALLPQQLRLVWDLLLKADPEGPSLIISAAVRH